MRTVTHRLAPGVTAPASTRQSDIFDPNSGTVQAKVDLGSAAVLDAAVDAALAAQPAWAATNPQRRARVMFKFKELVEAKIDELAALLSSEHGKVHADAKGDIQRGLEVIEFCCGIPHAVKGNIRMVQAPASTSIRCASRSALARGSPRSISPR